MPRFSTTKCCCLSLVTLCVSLICQLALADLTVRGYDPNKHNRFANSSQFIGNLYDWSGVARSSAGRWATMISPNYFLSATHFHPGVGDKLTLYGGNDLAGPSQIVNVVGGQQIAGTDLWLGRIDTPTIFGTFEVAAFGNPNTYLNQEIFLYGVTSNIPVVTGQMKLGRNEVDAYLPNFSDPILGSAKTDVVIYDYDTPTGGVGDDEALIQGGDSGAPSFMIWNGRPILMGIHWFKYFDNEFGSPLEGSGDSLIDNYVNQINAAMGGQRLRIIAAPEPSSLALLTLPVVVWHYRRRRRAALSAQAT